MYGGEFFGDVATSGELMAFRRSLWYWRKRFRKYYNKPREFAAARRAINGETYRSIAADMGVCAETVRHWSWERFYKCGYRNIREARAHKDECLRRIKCLEEVCES